MTAEQETPRRPAWKASLIGAAIAGVPVSIPVIHLFAKTGVPGGYAGAAVGAALGFVLLAAIGLTLLGAIAGALLLRKRRSFLFALWAIPCSVIGTAILGIVIYETYGRLTGRHQEVASNTQDLRLQYALANRSGKAIFMVEVTPAEFGSSAIHHDLITPSNSEIINDWKMYSAVPERRGQMLGVTWRRPITGAAFSNADRLSISTIAQDAGVRMQANVPWPADSTLSGQDMLIVFLPGDKVQIRVVDKAMLMSGQHEPVNVNGALQGFPARADR